MNRYCSEAVFHEDLQQHPFHALVSAYHHTPWSRRSLPTPEEPGPRTLCGIASTSEQKAERLIVDRGFRVNTNTATARAT
jgi:hypothetical protein